MLLAGEYGDTFEKFDATCTCLLFCVVARKVVGSSLYSTFKFAVVDTNFTLGEEIPFRMDFDAIATFFPNATQVPTASDLFQVMVADNMKYQTYISEYVWKSEPLGEWQSLWLLGRLVGRTLFVCLFVCLFACMLAFFCWFVSKGSVTFRLIAYNFHARRIHFRRRQWRLL